MSSIPDYLGLRKVSDMERDEVHFPRDVMNKLIMNYLVTGSSPFLLKDWRRKLRETFEFGLFGFLITIPI